MLIWLRRLLLLLPGLVIACLAVILFPFIDQRLPFGLAVIITYCLVAYAGIPLMLKVVRLVHRPQHIPLYALTPDQLPANPVNICLIGTQEEVKHAMRRAGWYEADHRTLTTIAKMAFAILFKRRYNNAPFSSLYLFGRKQDFGFQIPIGTSPFKRHHIRFWKVPHNNGADGDSRFWGSIGVRPKEKRATLWVGAATYDRGIGIALHNAQIDHIIHGDTNAERDFVVETLKPTGLIKSIKKLKASEPYTLRDRVLWIRVIADGDIVLVSLRRKRPAIALPPQRRAKTPRS